jgi:hypothetical protein
LIRALYEGEISINYLLRRAGKSPKADPEQCSGLLAWQSFAHLGCQPGNLSMAWRTEDIAVPYIAESHLSANSELMVRMIQEHHLPAENEFWMGAQSSAYYTRPEFGPECPSSRLKFPEAA